ncbi:fimbrial protein [Acinetobacter pullicarnis]|uniref:fimbrial protein n=1 Tax=Acinetobacter pullicarnis TaxID=2576829 RepID=UPI0011245A2E|nr:fimbrial protein [Acinetobacter pullicarnis]
MRKIYKGLFIVTALFASNYALANCSNSYGKPNTTKIEMNGMMPSYALTGPLKQGDLVTRVTVDYKPSKTDKLKCTPDSQVLLKMQRANYAAVDYMGEVPVPHAYYIHKDARGNSKPDDPSNDWIYTVQLPDGEFFYNNQFGNHGREINVPESDDYGPKQLIISLYAGKDNPTTPLTFGSAGQVSFMAHIQLNGWSSTDSEGLIYSTTGTITPAPIVNICSLDVGSKNLTFNLPRTASSVFQKIGDVSGNVTENLTVDCSGEMIASMKLSNANFIQDMNGENTIIKPAKDGQDSQALGVGFVLSSDGQRINSEDFVKIPQVMGKGKTNIPIKAEYYRFGSDIKAGNVEATADFTVTFN